MADLLELDVSTAPPRLQRGYAHVQISAFQPNHPGPLQNRNANPKLIQPCCIFLAQRVTVAACSSQSLEEPHQQRMPASTVFGRYPRNVWSRGGLSWKQLAGEVWNRSKQHGL